MYRFEKKAALVCAAASLTIACCLPLNANTASALDLGETRSIESKADLSSAVSDGYQPVVSTVIKDGWQLDETSGVWYYGKTVNTKLAGCKPGAIGIGLIPPMTVQCRLAILM